MSDQPPLVWIEWIDAASQDGWQPARDIDATPQKCVTVGFLVKETPEAVAVAGSIGDEDVACTMIIPRRYITRREPMQSPFFVAIDARAEELRHG